MTRAQVFALALLVALAAVGMFIPVVDDGQLLVFACDGPAEGAPGGVRDCQMMDVSRAVVERSR